MAQGVITSAGAIELLSNGLGAQIPYFLPWQLMLWTKAIVPTYATVIGDLTEAKFSGYNRANLTRNIWTSPQETDGCASSTWGEQPILWNVNDDTNPTIYGWGAVSVQSGLLLIAQALDDDDVITLHAGGQYQILPTLTLVTGMCPTMARRQRRTAKFRFKRR